MLEAIGGGNGDLPGNLCFLFVLLFAFFCPLSIAASQLFGGLAFLLWLFRLPKQGTAAEAYIFLVPTVLFLSLSVVSIVFSINPWASLWYSRNLLLFAIVPVAVYIIDSQERIRAILAAVILGALITTVWGAVQVVLGTAGGASGQRLTGFLGHYMTAGGELMILVMLLLATVFYAGTRRDRLAAGVALAVLAAGMVLTQTRNVYIGAAVGIVALLVAWRPAVVILLPFALSLAVLLSPPLVRDRIFSIVNLDDASIQRRLKMVEVGQAVLADHPLFGVGPQQLEVVYDRYKGDASDPHEVHLHNNPLQIAANAVSRQ